MVTFGLQVHQNVYLKNLIVFKHIGMVINQNVHNVKIIFI